MFLFSCKIRNTAGENLIAADTTSIAKGEKIFNKNCSGCHNFKRNGMAPHLSGLIGNVSLIWIRHFIKDPKEVIASGDNRAQQLVETYQTVMPSFPALGEEDINAIIAYINSKQGSLHPIKEVPGSIKNPIPEPIQFSGLVAGLELVTQMPPSGDSGQMPLTRITKMEDRPSNGGLFILDLRGKLYNLQNSKQAVYMDMAKLKPAFIHQPGLASGFGSFAFHPQFLKNGLLYTTHTEPGRSARADFDYADTIKSALQWVLTEWKTKDPNGFPFRGTGREILRADMVSPIHGFQEIIFNPLSKPGSEDYGLLYIGVGDGGAVENGYDFLTHNKGKIWGAVLRIDPAGRNSKNGKYGIPEKNPFAKNNPGALGEIYAYGFRNPHRITWSRSGQMLVCNIGQKNMESLYIVSPGQDCGWPIREGSFVNEPRTNLESVFPLKQDDSIHHITYPVVEYDHDEGLAISGGYEYTGNAIPLLKGKYFFGDIPTGRLFYTNMSEIKPGNRATIKELKVAFNGVVKTFHQLSGSNRVDLHFGRDHTGELYFLTKSDGKIYKIINASIKPVDHP